MNHALLPKTTNANLPATYEAAKLALSECNRIDECKAWSDKAEALASYARQAEDTEMEKTAMRIRARAIRRCGELLNEIEKAQGARTDKLKDGDGPKFDTPRQAAAKAAGISERQVKTSIRVANVPNEIFVDQVESDSPPTITNLAKQGVTQSNSMPMYEKLGMTKKAFQAGMYFRGDVANFIKAIRAYDPQDIIDGCDGKQRKALRESIQEIDSFNDKLIAKI